jgi:hypothetical protein
MKNDELSICSDNLTVYKNHVHFKYIFIIKMDLIYKSGVIIYA